MIGDTVVEAICQGRGVNVLSSVLSNGRKVGWTTPPIAKRISRHTFEAHIFYYHNHPICYRDHCNKWVSSSLSPFSAVSSGSNGHHRYRSSQCCAGYPCFRNAERSCFAESEFHGVEPPAEIMCHHQMTPRADKVQLWMNSCIVFCTHLHSL